MTVENSSSTSMSHTMIDEPGPASSPLTEYSDNVRTLLHILQPENRHLLLKPSPVIPTASLLVVKNTLETFAAQVGEQQEQSLNESRKRKRRGSTTSNAPDTLKMHKVFVDGFETEQVWQQAKKIIEGVLNFSERRAEELLEKDEVMMNGDGQELHVDDKSNPTADHDEEAPSSDFEDFSGEEPGAQGNSGGLDSQSDTEDSVVVQGNGEIDDDVQDAVKEEEAVRDAEYDADPYGLNDGFFSIDDFNRQTQRWEDQDARGDPEDDQDSDEEAIKWNMDPLNPIQSDRTGRNGSNNRGKKASAEDEDEEEEDGPTFGNMTLDAPEGESEDDVPGENPEEDGGYNANEIFYKDFFAPPPKKGKRGGASKSVQFADPQQEQRHEESPAKQDVERAMADVRRELFDDESDANESDDGLSEVSAGDPRSRRSAHERRQAKLAEEIRWLEAASVAKREWTLAGEAAAADRPVNSLLEEDLDFEHVGKPVPVVTPDVSESIEALIKRRILAQEFDEVRRRRPDADSVPASTRRGLVALDTKSSKGLAEIYAEEHVKKANPDAYVTPSDEKLQREEKEIESLWHDLCGRLDALSSWHYRPKPAAPTLSVVTDVATVSMEDAQPATAQGVAGAATRLAPQEVYRPGDAASQAPTQDEVVTHGGMPLARDEMSREDRARRHRRNKERVRKAGGASDPAAPASKAARSRALVGELKKGGVRVINRRGELTDVEGRKTKPTRRLPGGSFKL